MYRYIRIEGQEAYLNHRTFGISPTNPYPYGTEQYDEWDKGFYQERGDHLIHDVAVRTK
jgi:hypothetical protein